MTVDDSMFMYLVNVGTVLCSTGLTLGSDYLVNTYASYVSLCPDTISSVGQRCM